MLRFAQQAPGLQGVAGTVLATQEARHGTGLEVSSAGERRTAFLDLVAKAVGLDLRFDDVFSQSTFLDLVETHGLWRRFQCRKTLIVTRSGL